MLYYSGTTGKPKGVKRELPLTPLPMKLTMKTLVLLGSFIVWC